MLKKLPLFFISFIIIIILILSIIIIYINHQPEYVMAVIKDMNINEKLFIVEFDHQFYNVNNIPLRDFQFRQVGDLMKFIFDRKKNQIKYISNKK